ncbi:MAG TPA: glycosyltransferase [Gemmatimonadaceae bacterium]|nr:glycosyltransferase [Gemmatimonadaceae bacterium]
MRWAGLSKYLARLGWDVHVVTASPNAADVKVPGVTVHVRTRRRTFNDWYVATSSRIRGSAPAAAQATSTASPATRATPAGTPAASVAAAHKPSLLKRAVGQLRGGIGMAMFFPDNARGWVMRAARTARGLLRAQPFDLVITSGPPHSAHFAGVLATAGRREPLWVDMRDPWSQALRDAQWDANKSRMLRVLVPRLEGVVFRHARRVVVNTTELAGMLRADSAAPPVVYVPNGIDGELLPARTAERLSGCSIAYVGTVYGARNVAGVLAAMRDLLRDRPELASALKLRIAGHINSTHRARLQADVDAHGVAQCVEHVGVLPRAGALELLNRSHLALVLAQGQHMMVPAKLYECVGLGVPTLVLTETDSATAREARRIGAFTLDGGDVQGIRALLEDALSGRLPGAIPATAPISHADLARELDAVLRAEGAHTR